MSTLAGFSLGQVTQLAGPWHHYALTWSPQSSVWVPGLGSELQGTAIVKLLKMYFPSSVPSTKCNTEAIINPSLLPSLHASPTPSLPSFPFSVQHLLGTCSVPHTIVGMEAPLSKISGLVREIDNGRI